MTAVDVNERALLLARENAAALGVADRYRAEQTRARRPPLDGADADTTQEGEG